MVAGIGITTPKTVNVLIQIGVLTSHLRRNLNSKKENVAMRSLMVGSETGLHALPSVAIGIQNINNATPQTLNKPNDYYEPKVVPSKHKPNPSSAGGGGVAEGDGGGNSAGKNSKR